MPAKQGHTADNKEARQPPRGSLTPSVRPEILAPAGDLASMRAALRAGADAVYFGLKGHNARARAENFSEDNLAEVVHMIHTHGAKAYVTLNTLVFDHEMDDVARKLVACAQAGVDAIIVQDVGVVAMAKHIAPHLPVHASTQMTCTDADSVVFASSLGVERVVVARELSVDDIAAIRKATDVELEVFVHGALCISYSGQCLTSEAIGGRSANRGACAQACRLPYDLIVDGKHHDTGGRDFLLSPTDLDASSLVPRLAQLGVSSLKIEGRLKGPEYAASATALYRAAVDGLDDVDHRDALQRQAHLTFSRGSDSGFLGGTNHQTLVDGTTCDHRGIELGRVTAVRREGRAAWLELSFAPDGEQLWQARAAANADKGARGLGVLVQARDVEDEIGGRVWDADASSLWLGPDVKLPPASGLIGRRVFVTDDPDNDAAIRHRVEQQPVRESLRLQVRAVVGEPLHIQAHSARGLTANVHSNVLVEPARQQPMTAHMLTDELGRLGDTPYQLSSVELDAPSPCFVQKSVLAKTKRALVEQLLASAMRRHEVQHTTPPAVAAPVHAPPPPGLWVLCRTRAQAHAAIDAGADGVYLDFLAMTGLSGVVDELRSRQARVGLAPPRIRKPGEDKIDRFLWSLKPDALLVRSLGMLQSLPAHQPTSTTVVGDFSLNCSNAAAAQVLFQHGIHAVTPSYDLDAQQLLAMMTPSMAPYAEVVVHQPMPLFHMEHCIIAANLSSGTDHRTCGRPCEHHSIALRDRAGVVHPVEADVGCRNTVFHASAQSGAHLMGQLQAAGVARHRIELVRESAEDVKRIVALTLQTMKHGYDATAYRSLHLDTGYGVVRGALRVLP
jgi:U32 family peptidase